MIWIGNIVTFVNGVVTFVIAPQTLLGSLCSNGGVMKNVTTNESIKKRWNETHNFGEVRVSCWQKIRYFYFERYTPSLPLERTDNWVVLESYGIEIMDGRSSP